MSDYEQMLEDFYSSLLKPGDICIDVGAHAGRHAFPMARLVGESGAVIGFEPIPRMAQQIRDALAADRSLANVSLNQLALSDSEGECEFVLVHEAPGYSGLRERHYDFAVTTERIAVTTQRLDSRMPGLGTIRFIKIDCEGAELHVLRGGRALIQRDRPIISIECGDAALESYDYTAGDIFDFFVDLGYRIESITRQSHSREEFIAASARQQYWDYLAFPD